MNNKQGMVVLELLLVLAVATLIGVAGSRMIFVLLDLLGDRYVSTSEKIQFDLFESEMRRAWTARLDHSFQTDDWLRISGEKISQGYTLKKFSMRMTGTEGKPLHWTLENTDRGWRHYRRDEATDAQVGEVSRLKYQGDIILEIEALNWLGGTAPNHMQWRFPSCSNRHLQQGFAIHSL